MGPKNQAHYSSNNFPLTLSVYLSNYREVSLVNFYSIKDADKKLVKSLIEPTSDIATVSWDEAPEPGSYQLIAEAKTKNNQYFEKQISISIDYKKTNQAISFIKPVLLCS